MKARPRPVLKAMTSGRLGQEVGGYQDDDRSSGQQEPQEGEVHYKSCLKLPVGGMAAVSEVDMDVQD